MTPRTRRRIRSFAYLAAACVPVAWTYEYMGDQRVTIIGLAIGLALAAPLLMLEESRFAERTRALPFTVALLVKTVALVGILVGVFSVMGLIVGLLQGLTMDDFWASFTDPSLGRQVFVGFLLYLVILFFRQLDRLLGPGVLVGYLVGRYHRPRREDRIFLFLDIKGATGLAERLHHEAYYSLVNDFFRGFSRLVQDLSGEIYQYVGDEVVISWKKQDGVRDGNCVRFFFGIDDVVAAHRDRYMDRYGVVPEYKAGLHAGEVIAAEIGDLKKEIVFNGDVLNTTARIEGECNRLGHRLLVSQSLMDELEIPPGLAVTRLGPVELRGKAAPMELVGVEREGVET